MRGWIVAFFIICGPVGAAKAQLSGEAAIESFNRGQAAMQRKDWKGAIAQFEPAVAHREVGPAAQVHVGFAREELGDQVAAAQAYRLVLEMPNTSSEVRSAAYDRLTAIGYDRLQKNDFSGAESALKPVVADRRFDALFYYGMSLARQDKWRETEDAAKRLLEVNPFDAEAWTLLIHSQSKRAEIAAADPSRTAEASKLIEQVKATGAKAAALPFLLKDLELTQENGGHVVRATMIGNAAAAGSWCIIDFKLHMQGKSWRASVMTEAPAKGQKAAVRTVPATNSRFKAPPISERISNVSYPAAYCEKAGAAAITPPEAARVSLQGCPEAKWEAQKLLRGRNELGTNQTEKDTDFAYPAGGIVLFEREAERLTVRGDLFQFGLHGPVSDHLDRFQRRYRGSVRNCTQDHCAAVVSDSYKEGVLTNATLLRTYWPEGMLPKGTYLQCLYR